MKPAMHGCGYRTGGRYAEVAPPGLALFWELTLPLRAGLMNLAGCAAGYGAAQASMPERRR